MNCRYFCLNDWVSTATYPDLSRPTLLYVNIFNADIFLAVISCCSHAVGVFVPPVLALDSVVLSPSRLWQMTVFTNALSMADMLSF